MLFLVLSVCSDCHRCCCFRKMRCCKSTGACFKIKLDFQSIWPSSALDGISIPYECKTDFVSILQTTFTKHSSIQNVIFSQGTGGHPDTSLENQDTCHHEVTYPKTLEYRTGRNPLFTLFFQASSGIRMDQNKGFLPVLYSRVFDLCNKQS